MQKKKLRVYMPVVQAYQKIFNLFRQYTVPFNIGLNFHTAVGPRLENWPSATSMKNIGSPATSSMMTYGIRNAPKVKKENN